MRERTRSQRRTASRWSKKAGERCPLYKVTASRMWFRIVVPRTGRRYWLLAVAVSLAYGALLVFLRGAPSLQSDAGIFLSVAARLLHGDRLYADVFDNKDPYNEGSGATARFLGSRPSICAIRYGPCAVRHGPFHATT